MTTDEMLVKLDTLTAKAGGDGTAELIVNFVGAVAVNVFQLFVMGPGGHQERFESTVSVEDVLNKADAALPVPT